jgi:hypothetical protein
MASPRLQIVHSIPGRLRVRLPTNARVPGLEERLLAHSGVRTARHFPRTRSVVIQYHPEETTAETLLHALTAIAGVESDTGFEVGDLPLSESITRAVSYANTALTRRTANQIDLPTLLALSLGGWAVLQLVRGRARPLPWPTALWYAYELFRHRGQGGRQTPVPVMSAGPLRSATRPRH